MISNNNNFMDAIQSCGKTDKQDVPRKQIKRKFNKSRNKMEFQLTIRPHFGVFETIIKAAKGATLAIPGNADVAMVSMPL